MLHFFRSKSSRSEESCKEMFSVSVELSESFLFLFFGLLFFFVLINSFQIYSGVNLAFFGFFINVLRFFSFVLSVLLTFPLTSKYQCCLFLLFIVISLLGTGEISSNNLVGVFSFLFFKIVLIAEDVKGVRLLFVSIDFKLSAVFVSFKGEVNKMS